MKILSFVRLVGCAAAWFVFALSMEAEPSLPPAVSLAGEWRFQLDRADAGIAERWFARALPERVRLPGTLSAQGIGDPVTVETKWIGGIVDKSWFTAPEMEKYRQQGNVKVPFWLQPEKYYAGAAWYQRDFEVPAAWEGLTLELLLERPHWETRVWVDAEAHEPQNALATAHRYELRPLKAGKHTLTIRVDNRMVVDVGENSHSVSDHTQGNWNGIVGRIELRARPGIWIAAQRMEPKNDGTVRVEVTLRNTLFDPVAGTLEATVREKRTGRVAGRGRSEFSYGRGTMEEGRHVFATHTTEKLVVKLDGPPKLWSEFTPELYEVETKLLAQQGREGDAAMETFAFREIAAEGTQFALNGRKIYLRGTLDCCIFPRTGHPPVDVAEWKRILGVAKAHGLNLIRFHSWCPPEAAFVAADELGFYFHVEASSWANQSTTLGDGKPVDQWIMEETGRILRAYGNHPSFLLMAYGNEPGGPKHKAWLAKYVEHFKAVDPRRLWTSGAGWPQLPENQWHNTPEPRIQGWGEGLKSRINARPPETRTDYRAYIAAHKAPVVSHEIGQWCAYPNFDEIRKYTGYLKPRNFEIFRERLLEHGMLDQARDFLIASGKLQTLCYKEEIESALRTPGMAGFELLDLHDFPGQGTALVGVLDPFWEEKGYVTPAEYSRFCGPTVPLARLAKRVFTTTEKLETEIEVAHFGAAPLEQVATICSLVGDDGKTVLRQQLQPNKPVPNGALTILGSLTLDLKDVPAPARYKLVVDLGQIAGFSASPTFANDWDVWVYPPKAATDAPPGITIASHLDAAAQAALDAGGKVLLLVPPARVAPDPKLGKIALGFSSIFWNTAWTKRQPPHTLGILCDPKHPLFGAFPTDSHSNWQWWYLVTRAGAMILDDLPPALRPGVQVIDDWFTARRLGLVFEAKLGRGRLVVCSIDLERDLETNHVARQFRHSLLRYMAGEAFQPQVEVSQDAIAALFTSARPSNVVRLGAKIIHASSEDAAHGHVAANAIDGDPNTLWHTRWEPVKDPMPHHLVIDLGREVALCGITYLPRQDMGNGRLAEAEVWCGNDANTWPAAPVVTTKWPNSDQLQTVRFPAPVKARHLKLVAKREVHDNPFAAVAELDVLMEPGGH